MQALEISQECSSPSCPAVPWRINVNPLFSRIYCPAHCKDEPSYWAPVFGTNVYADVSTNLSLCVWQSCPRAGLTQGFLGRNSRSLVVIPCGDGQIWGRQAWGALLFSKADLFWRTWMCQSSSLGCGHWVWRVLLLSSTDPFLEIWLCPLTSPSFGPQLWNHGYNCLPL